MTELSDVDTEAIRISGAIRISIPYSSDFMVLLTVVSMMSLLAIIKRQRMARI